MRQVERNKIVETPTQARAGVTEHNERYVLLLGTTAVVALFVTIYVAFFK